MRHNDGIAVHRNSDELVNSLQLADKLDGHNDR